MLCVGSAWAFNLEAETAVNFPKQSEIGGFGTEVEFHRVAHDQNWKLLVGAPTHHNGSGYNCDVLDGECNRLGTSLYLKKLYTPHYFFENGNSVPSFGNTVPELGNSVPNPGNTVPNLGNTFPALGILFPTLGIRFPTLGMYLNIGI